MPLAYADSWTTAAERVRTELIASIKDAYATRFSVEPSADRDAWLDVLPARVNCWAIFAGGGNDVAISDTDAPPGSVLMAARVEGRFESRDDARYFGMLILGALPVYHKGNVEWFRMSENPRVEPEQVRLANDQRRKTYYKLIVPCLLVFRTGEEF